MQKNNLLRHKLQRNSGNFNKIGVLVPVLLYTITEGWGLVSSRGVR